MKTPDILVLVGLVIQIVAGFIFSVEVIGLDRIAGWTKSLALFETEVVEGGSNKPFFNRASQTLRITSGLGSGLGILLGKVLGDRLFGDVTKLKEWPILLFALMTGLIGGILGMGLHQSLLYGLRFAVASLRGLERRTRAGASGVLDLFCCFWDSCCSLEEHYGKVSSVNSNFKLGHYLISLTIARTQVGSAMISSYPLDRIGILEPRRAPKHDQP